MPPTYPRGVPFDRLRFVTLLIFFFLCLVGGGASRPDIVSLLYLRPAAILCIAILVLTPGPVEIRRYRTLFLMLLALAAVIVIQLIPLPPGLWLSLPGRDRYAEALVFSGPEAWHPISLTPDLTLNSLVALIVPLAALTGYAAIAPEQRRKLLPVLLIGACASAVMGVGQLSSGYHSAAYLYDVTHVGSAVGFFSNRNHQGALLAMTFPMLRIWTLMPAKDPQYRRSRFWIAVGIGLMLIPVILVTGSRAGVALGLAGLAAAYLIAVPVGASEGARTTIVRTLRTALLSAALVLPLVAIFYGRALALDRLLGQDLQAELRIQHTPLMLRMIGEFFPFGTGFGSFDPVFRGFEPDSALNPRYFNRAHNDLIELGLTGGLPALLLFAIFLVWLARNTFAAFRPRRGRTPDILLARLGAVMIGALFLASLVDYPLRTPLMSIVFVIACGWLAEVRSGSPEPAPQRR